MRKKMNYTLLLSGLFAGSVWAETLGDSLISLQAAVQENNPKLQQVIAEMNAASARTVSAGALADPVFKLELMDFTPEGKGKQYLPGKTGQTKYTLMQDLPWYGKRDLQTSIAEQQADAAKFKTAFRAHQNQLVDERLGRMSAEERARFDDEFVARHAIWAQKFRELGPTTPLLRSAFQAFAVEMLLDTEQKDIVAFAQARSASDEVIQHLRDAV